MQITIKALARRLGVALAMAAMPAIATVAAAADPVADFYRGKSITLVIGYSVGGGYDLYGRLLARHLGKHIPGQPTIVPQNRDGAGSQRATMYLYSAAPKDGSVIGTFSRGMTVAPLLAGAPFDARNFAWLGSIATDVQLCMVSSQTPVKTWADMISHPLTLGGLGAGSDPDNFALMFRNVFGAKIKLVTGYPGTNEVALAMERGEVDGICGLSWSTVKTRHLDWLNAGKVAIPVQASMTRELQLGAVPIVTELITDPEQLQIVKLIVASQAMARPFAAPPGIPEDRRRALIRAFEETMTDAEFLAEAAKMKVDVNPLDAAGIERILAEIYATPKAVVAKAAKAIIN